MCYCHYCKLFIRGEDVEFLHIARWTVGFHPICLAIFREKLRREYGICYLA
jgi:hypothetical protein